MSTALVWFRRDLRLHDNPALNHAAAAHQRVVPVYIHAPEEEAPWAPGAASRWWLHHSLAALEEALLARRSALLLRDGPSLEALQALARETGASAVYWNRLYEPAIIARDKTVKAALRKDGLQAESFNANLLLEPWTVLKDDGDPYKVFTPFWKACLRLLPPPAPLSAPERLEPAPTRLASLARTDLRLLPGIGWYTGLATAWRPGEAGAQARLERFCGASGAPLDGYARGRDIPGADAVSRLSPHLHFGEISPRQIWTALGNRVAGDPLGHKPAEAYLRQLGWREFAHHVLYHWPDSPQQALQARFDDYPWRSDRAALMEAWRRGRTGYPLVDAGMRELWRTGWMHNRTRMLVASFLTKNCRIPWQEGERWFWDTLVDADLANNTLGWQWTAGCGTDAAPYFRVFNPVRQGARFDPDGAYVRRWVPELAPLPERWLHQPWALPAAERQALSFTPGLSYPAPVVDFTASREAALQAYERIKGG